MSITAHTRTEDDTSAKMRFQMLASPLAALLYPSRASTPASRASQMQNPR